MVATVPTLALVVLAVAGGLVVVMMFPMKLVMVVRVEMVALVLVAAAVVVQAKI